MEGTSDYDLAMEWYLKYGEREILETTRRNDYPHGSRFYMAGVANSNDQADINCRTWKITPKALKLIRNLQEEADRRDAYLFKLEAETTDPN